jgi:hypothetical protein
MNPELEQELGLQPQVRGRELHCRRGWNDDLWSASADDIVLEVRFKTPARERSADAVGDALEDRDGVPTVEAIVQAWDEPARAEAMSESPRP